MRDRFWDGFISCGLITFGVCWIFVFAILFFTSSPSPKHSDPAKIPREVKVSLEYINRGLTIYELEYEGRRHAFVEGFGGLAKIGDYPIEKPAK